MEKKTLRQKLNESRNPKFYEFEGDLYEGNKLVRKNYSGAKREIKKPSDFSAALRSGGYAWPGGYPIVYFTSDGEMLCSKCAEKNHRKIAYSILSKSNDGWRVIGLGIEAVSADYLKEDGNEELLNYCANCNEEFGELA